MRAEGRSIAAVGGARPAGRMTVAPTAGSPMQAAAGLPMATWLTVIGGSPSAAQTPTVSVTPATGLTGFQFVHPPGSGFEPEPGAPVAVPVPAPADHTG